MHPEFGDAPHPDDFHDRMSVFWACGVTPQLAIQNAKLPLAITHLPGHMLITDQLGSDVKILSSESDSLTMKPAIPHSYENKIDQCIRGNIEAIVMQNDPRQIGYLIQSNSASIASDHTCLAAEAICCAKLGTAVIATGTRMHVYQFSAAFQTYESTCDNGLFSGFYIPEAGSAETDGPPGAAAVAVALEKLGFHCIVVTDERCRSVVSASIEVSDKA